MKKRILALLLAAVLALSVATTAAAANYTTDYNSFSTPGSSDYAYWSGSQVVRSSGTSVSEVKWMQAALNWCIKNKGLTASYLDVDGSFGPASQSATRAFQKEYGLSVDGSFGPSTIAKMKEVLSASASQPVPTPTPTPAANHTTNYNSFSAPDSSDYAYWSGSQVVRSSGTSVSEVKWMQAALNWCIKNKGLNASYLDVDGSFGPASQSATRAFQKKFGLSVDGSFGPDTIEKMKVVLGIITPPAPTPTPTLTPTPAPVQTNYNTDYSSFAAPDSSDYAYWNGSQVVRSSGTTTSEVKWMQAALNYCIKNKGLSALYLDVDGSFGPASQWATEAFQSTYGLSVDGSFGPSTIAKMKEILGLPVPVPGSYDQLEAIKYGKLHWDDGDDDIVQCAEFVSNCLTAGGCTAWSKSCTSLISELKRGGWGTEYKLNVNSDGTISASQNEGKVAVGDPIFCYCSREDRNYVHVFLCSGQDSAGYLKGYAHNRPLSGRIEIKPCWYCGNSMSAVYVFHMKNSTPLKSASAPETPVPEVAVSASYDTSYSSYSVPDDSDYAYWNGNKSVLASGTTVNEVRWMQAALNYCIQNKGLNASCLEVDGSFGPASKSAAKAFQSQNGLSADGSFGPATINKMKGILGIKSAEPTVVSGASKITTAQIQAVLNQYGYTTGKYWNYPSGGNASSGYTASNRPGRQYSYRYNGVECYGFANFVMHKVTGTEVNPNNGNRNGWTYLKPSQVTDLRTGDIVRIGKDNSNGHSGVVLTVNKDGKCTFAECWGGVNNKLNIGKTLTSSHFGTHSSLSTMKKQGVLLYVYRYVG